MLEEEGQGIAVYYDISMRPSVPDVIATLRRVPLFAELSDQQLGAIAERATRKRYERYAIVFSEGDACGEWRVGRAALEAAHERGLGIGR